MAASNPKEYGFDVKFVEKLDKDNIECVICFMVLREPLQGSKCGHRYCKKCIEEFHEKNPKKCPQDWQDNEWFKDLGKEREILDLKVRCKNHRDGCTWQNELRDQEEHLKTCDFVTIQCNLQCGEPVLRKNLKNHLDKDCPLISTCEYSDFGCLFKGTRDQLYNHMSEAINQHFSLEMKHEIQNVKKEFSDKLQEKDLRIQKLTKEFDAQLKERDDEIKRLRKDVEDAKKDLQLASNENNENHKAIEETKKDFTRVIDETKIEQQKAIEETTKDFTRVIDETKIEQQKAIEETKKDFIGVVNETKIEQQKAMEETKKDFTRVIDETKIEQQKAIAETKKDFNRAIDETKTEQQKAIEETKKDVTRVIDETNTEQQKAIEETKKDFTQVIDETKTEQQKAIEETKKDFNRAIDETKIEQQKASEETKKDFTRVTNQTKTEQQKAMEEIKNNFTRVVNEIKTEQEKAIEETKKDFNRVVNQTKTEQQKAIEETKKDFTRVVNETKTEQQKALNKSMEIISMMLYITDKNTHEFINGSLRERSDHVHNLNKKLAEENKLTLQILSLPQCPYSFTIENFKFQFEEAKKTNKRTSSPNFLTVNGYLGRLNIYLNGYRSAQDNHVSVFFQNLKGPYDNFLKWPIPWKSHSMTLLVNNREIGKKSSQNSDDGGKWKDNFIRPIGDEGKDLGVSKTFDHKLIENLTDEDVVAIKFDMDCEAQEH
ncbi:calponin homology domain-containing protein DDB_G0272472-like [Clytia hemisphaerica]|uniref:Uncharacterized protein n=1 Tax=Clytia hemisphaerica TaxID=252671 RepID=A0A7M6DKB4_9CNID